MATELDPPPEGAPERPRATVTPLKPAPAQPYPVTWINDAVLNLDAQPVVKGLLEQGAFTVIYGPSGSGKSFFTADISQHIATGTPWRGRKCPQGLVVYVASEAGASILKRFVGWRDNRLAASAGRVPLAILTRGPNLLEDLEVARLGDQLAELQQTAQLPLAFTVFDTLSRSIPGGDENNAEHMTMVIKASDYLRDRFTTATGYVHHSGKDPDKGARGHSSLFAAADVVLRVIDGCAAVEKVRDGVAGERFGFTLEPIELGQDADGDPVMTCLLNATDEMAEQPKKRLVRGIAFVSLQALREAIEAHGEQLPETSTIPRGARGCSVEQWRERFRLRYGDEHDSTVRAKAFWRAKEALLAAVAIGISDPWVWLA